ncbi:MAG: hypothetical protein ACM3ST_11820, partial [Bdellovibrio bacteriovorus]
MREVALMYRFAQPSLVLALSALFGLAGLSPAWSDTPPKGDGKDLVLITNSNGSISLLKRDPR